MEGNQESCAIADLRGANECHVWAPGGVQRCHVSPHCCSVDEDAVVAHAEASIGGNTEITLFVKVVTLS